MRNDIYTINFRQLLWQLFFSFY